MTDEEWQQMEDGKRAIECLQMHGYRRCDIAACNCGSWHGGHANERLSEIGYALSGVGLYHRGKTLLQEVQALIDEHEAAAADRVAAQEPKP